MATGEISRDRIEQAPLVLHRSRRLLAAGAQKQPSVDSYLRKISHISYYTIYVRHHHHGGTTGPATRTKGYRELQQQFVPPLQRQGAHIVEPPVK